MARDDYTTHDDLCEITGEHDHWCPPTERALIPHKPNGQWPKGLSGNMYGPKRLRAARALIDSLTDGGRTLIERLMVLGALAPDPNGQVIPPAVQVRAVVKLSDIFWGKEIRKKVSGTVKHEHTAQVVQAQATLAAHEFTDEQLELAEKIYLLEAERAKTPVDLDSNTDVTDADFEEA
jgi:hypothetical protein